METTPPREASQSPATCMSSDVLSKLELVQCVYPCVCLHRKATAVPFLCPYKKFNETHRKVSEY